MDLVKLRTTEKFDPMNDLEITEQTYVHNHHGGFRVDFVNNYIKEVISRPKRVDGTILKDDFATRSTD